MELTKGLMKYIPGALGGQGREEHDFSKHASEKEKSLFFLSSKENPFLAAGTNRNRDHKDGE